MGQLLSHYESWREAGGLLGQGNITSPDFAPFPCIQAAFTPEGLRSLGLLVLVSGGIALYGKLRSRLGGGLEDPRGFTVSKEGTYGTASWMGEKERKEVLKLCPISQPDGILLGKRNGKAVCLPVDTRLNRHIAVFGASGTGKSRGLIRPALFGIIERGESAIVTDSKGELYADTAELFRSHGYEVQVFNLVTPEHGDSWNCMSDLGGDTLLAQVLTNVIIGNTSSGKTDHFWDNGEGNLLKALILYVALDPTREPEEKNLPAVYEMLLRYSAAQLTALFERLPLDHPARGPYRLFSQASDTVRSGIVLGLGTRLQVLQNEAVARILRRSDIDLTRPGKKKCAIFVVLSDQDATMAFISSLFFSFLFIKLVRYADSTPEMRCAVPVNLILDEFNNIGKLGGAADGSDFTRTLSVIRSRGIYVMLAVQSLGQLQNRYPNNLWAEIVGNCDVQLLLGCTDDVTAEYFSARSGDMSIQVNSTMTVRQTMAIAQVIPQYRQTQGQGRRRLLTPDEVLRLPNHELLVVIRGHNLLKLEKVDFTELPMAKEIARASVLDYAPAGRPQSRQENPQATQEPQPTVPRRKPRLYSVSKPPEEFYSFLKGERANGKRRIRHLGRNYGTTRGGNTFHRGSAGCGKRGKLLFPNSPPPSETAARGGGHRFPVGRGDRRR